MFFFSKTTITALLLAAAATIVGTQAGDVEERKLETLYSEWSVQAVTDLRVSTC